MPRPIGYYLQLSSTNSLSQKQLVATFGKTLGENLVQF